MARIDKIRDKNIKEAQENFKKEIKRLNRMLKSSFNLTKTELVSSIITYIKANSQDVVKDFIYLAPHGDFSEKKFTENKDKIREFVLSTCIKANTWDLFSLYQTPYEETKHDCNESCNHDGQKMLHVVKFVNKAVNDIPTFFGYVYFNQYGIIKMVRTSCDY